jgi:hypothetical protein
MSRPPLPILTTVAAAYRSLFENFLAFLHIVAGWFVLSAAANIGLGLLARTEPQHQVATAASLVVGVAGSIATAVAWHRFILLGEQPVGRMAFRPEPWWSYFKRTWIIVGVLLPLMITISAAFWLLPTIALIWLFVAAAGYVTTVLIIGRLLLIFPAAAVGEARMTASASWAFTAHNSWRMFAGLALSVTPIIFLSVLLTASLADRNRELAVVIALALSYTNVTIGSAFASHAYRHFIDGARAETFS